MNKLKGNTKKFGRCHIHGQGCEVCDEIRSGHISRTTEYQEYMDYEFENMSDEDFEEYCKEQLPVLEGCRDFVRETISKMKEKESEVKVE